MAQDSINEDKEQVNLHLDSEVIRIYGIYAPTKSTDRKKLMQDVLTEVAFNLKKKHKALFREVEKNIVDEKVIEHIEKKSD